LSAHVPTYLCTVCLSLCFSICHDCYTVLAHQLLLALCLQNELFQLVTDQGFLHEPRVVWETLSNIEGDGMFVDGRFVTVPPKAAGPYRALTVDISEDQQISHEWVWVINRHKNRAWKKTL
jgi:hypothetical protein